MARKSKGFSELLGQRKNSQHKQKQLEVLKSKLEQESFQFEQIVLEPEGEVKMSEVLTDFIEPYREEADTEQAYRRLLTLAVMAWNASLFPKEEQQDMVDKILNEGIPEADEELKEELKEILSELISRKQRYFSEYKRMIIDFNFKNIGGKYHLSVASTLSETSS